MQALFFKKYEVSQPFENPLENPIGGQTVLLGERRSTTAIAYQREESRGDQRDCFLSGEKKSRIVLDSARGTHKY